MPVNIRTFSKLVLRWPIENIVSREVFENRKLLIL